MSGSQIFGQAAEVLVEEGDPEWFSSPLEGPVEGSPPVLLEVLRGIASWWQRDPEWVEGLRDKEPVRALGGSPAGVVRVSRNHWTGLSLAESSGVLFGEGRADGGDADVVPSAGQGDGDRVEWSFDDDGGCAGQVVGPVQLGALTERGLALREAIVALANWGKNDAECETHRKPTV